MIEDTELPTGLALQYSRNAIPDFHVPISRTGESLDGIFLALFAFLPFLGPRSTAGVVSKFLPQSSKLLQSRLLVMNCRS